MKKADSPDDDLKALAREARRQIDGWQYDAFRAEGIADIEFLTLLAAADPFVPDLAKDTTPHLSSSSSRARTSSGWRRLRDTRTAA